MYANITYDILIYTHLIIHIYGRAPQGGAPAPHPCCDITYTNLIQYNTV